MAPWRHVTVAARVYIETSILGYLSGRPSRDVVVLARQRVTTDWWASRTNFECVVSDLVLEEAAQGDPNAAARRLRVAEGLAVLPYSSDVQVLATRIVDAGAMPRKAMADAFHVAYAALAGVEFLLTWNCTHIANAVMRPRVESLCRSLGYVPPTICTPDELAPVEEGQ
jgi:hypothetical protein